MGTSCFSNLVGTGELRRLLITPVASCNGEAMIVQLFYVPFDYDIEKVCKQVSSRSTNDYSIVDDDAILGSLIIL